MDQMGKHVHRDTRHLLNIRGVPVLKFVTREACREHEQKLWHATRCHDNILARSLSGAYQNQMSVEECWRGDSGVKEGAEEEYRPVDTETKNMYRQISKS
jgi:hypothetical protein